MCLNNPHHRFYCPLCAEVACGMKRQGEWIVLPHYATDKKAVMAQEGHSLGLSKPCRGGPVDYEKDKAP